MLGIGNRESLPSIFLIDDDLVSREVVATVLTLEGYEVHTAESGEAAVSQLSGQQFSPSVILMDAQLPGLNGVMLVEKLRGQSAATIVAISGSSLSPELEAATDAFLLKPFNPDTLRAHSFKIDPPKKPPQPIAPVISPETLAQFRQLMPEPTVKQIYAAVVADLNKRRTHLELAVNEGNREEISRIGHAIKGGCGMAGAMVASHIGARLEAESNDLDYCRTALDHLTEAISNLESMLEREFPD